MKPAIRIIGQRTHEAGGENPDTAPPSKGEVQGPDGGESERTVQELTASERDSLERVCLKTAPVSRRFFSPERSFVGCPACCARRRSGARARPASPARAPAGERRGHAVRPARRRGGLAVLADVALGDLQTRKILRHQLPRAVAERTRPERDLGRGNIFGKETQDARRVADVADVDALLRAGAENARRAFRIGPALCGGEGGGAVEARKWRWFTGVSRIMADPLGGHPRRTLNPIARPRAGTHPWDVQFMRSRRSNCDWDRAVVHRGRRPGAP